MVFVGKFCQIKLPSAYACIDLVNIKFRTIYVYKYKIILTDLAVRLSFPTSNDNLLVDCSVVLELIKVHYYETIKQKIFTFNLVHNNIKLMELSGPAFCCLKKQKKTVKALLHG